MFFGQRHRLISRLAAAGLLFVLAISAANRTRRPAKKVEETAAKEVPASATGHINEIRFWSLPDTTRIAVQISSTYKLKTDRLHNPERVFFDIVGAKPQGDLKGVQTIRVADKHVRQIRIAETQPGVTRIVVDLESQVDFNASQLTSPDRLMIEIRPLSSAKKGSSESGPGQTVLGQGVAGKVDVPKTEFVKSDVGKLEVVKASLERTPRTQTAPVVVDGNTPSRVDPSARLDVVPPKVPANAEVAMVTAPPPPVAIVPVKESSPAPEASTSPRVPGRSTIDPASPAKRYNSGDTSLTRALGLKFGKIVIDAGHGGHDVGTSGSSGLLEKDLVLDVAKRLAALVETRMQSEVVLTRNDDTYIALERRPQMANDAKADLFISIHANSSPVKTVSGVETYYLNFTTNRAALDVAARENASSGHSIFDLKDILQQIALRDKLDESREFAAKVQSAMVAQSVKTNTASRDRGVKKAPFIVLIGASMPSILAEIGFVTNSKDEGMMKKPEYRQKIAEALYRGLSQYASGLSHFQVAQQHKNASE